jgi:hypothetical protein
MAKPSRTSIAVLRWEIFDKENYIILNVWCNRMLPFNDILINPKALEKYPNWNTSRYSLCEWIDI